MKFQFLIDMLVSMSDELFEGDLSILRRRDGWRVIFTPLETKGQFKRVFDAWTPEPSLMKAATIAMEISDRVDPATPCR